MIAFTRDSAPYGKIDLITLALEEDLAGGDLTSFYFRPREENGTARIIARQEAVLAGVEVAGEVFRRVDSGLCLQRLKMDGARLEKGDAVLEISGRVESILAAERTALNFLQRLSGVATRTRAFVDAVAGTRARILDTRKTTPGFRILEKAAVAAGGGVNHRLHLSDAILVKDNHLAALKGEDLQGVIDRIHSDHPGIPVLLEADTLGQLDAFLALHGVERVLLDNMDTSTLREAVKRTAGRLPLEASGGVNLETVRAIAETGVDFISVGSLTHSAPAVDIALDLVSQ